ncbi:hypothetical protein VNI00_016850 [Paramarasmius palmivorus]|uniref:Piwi-domain-containing protein n=1 Tax=Paramarasmius palmivorus TaxID=297713 RepID=A0AAW0BD73_9AGAR
MKGEVAAVATEAKGEEVKDEDGGEEEVIIEVVLVKALVLEEDFRTEGRVVVGVEEALGGVIVEEALGGVMVEAALEAVFEVLVEVTVGDEDGAMRLQAFSKKLTSNTPEHPLRPGYGTQGSPVTLRANFFALRLPKDLVVYEYTVEISPKCDEEAGTRSRLFTLLEESSACKPFAGHYAHDSSQKLVSSKQLPQPLTINIKFLEEGETQPQKNAKVYTITITLSATIDTKEVSSYLSGSNRDYNIGPLLAALNLVQQRHATQKGIRVGTSKYFFPLESQGHFLSPGVQAIQGFYVSVRPVYKQLAVNVNACMTAFLDLPGNMVEALESFNRRSRGGMLTLPPNLVKNIKVTTTYLGYKKRSKVFAIGTASAKNQFFPHPKYKRISVEEYFKKEYNIRLQHATDLPVIDIGNKNKPVHVPAELCEIEPGQPYRGKLTGDETAKMIRVACNPPNINAEAIVGDGFSKLGITPPSDILKNFGISVSNEMTGVPGRVLAPPRLFYGQKAITASNGAWNITTVKFHKGAQVKSWWIMLVMDSAARNTIVSGPQDSRLLALRDSFVSKLTNCGMAMPRDKPVPFATPLLPTGTDKFRKDALGIIRTTLQNQLDSARGQKPDFVLVLLSHEDNFIYPGIKTIGDVELGLNTIHLQLDRAINGKRQDQYLSNVALKINTKLGGVNHQLDQEAMNWLKAERTMLVGIDVTHRGPGSKEGAPSIAAVVANVDDTFVQYPASLEIQQTHEIREMVTELEKMMVERLQAYKTKTSNLPDRVFVFRDGVSEGQYDSVLRIELPQILDAFKKFNTKDRKQPYRPRLSIVICGKRHHARFYPTKAEHADKTMNTRPGTVVDKGVTDVFDFDFYLQAHAGLQGSVKSTHYVVIYDENRFTADEIQQGVNNNSYLYARATRAVSLIPPAYYADQACERGRYYLNDFLTGEDPQKKKAEKAAKEKVFEDAKKAWGKGVHSDMRNTMFYM